MKDKIFNLKDLPADFKIADSIEDQILEYIKTHRWVYGSALIREFGMTQAGYYRVLARLAKRGILKDRGLKNILEKGSKQYRNSRLYERVKKT